MKREIVTLFAASAAVFLVACGSDSSGTNAKDEEAAKLQKEDSFDALPEYDTEDDLPNCVSKRKGEAATIDGDIYLCNGMRWENVGDYVENEESLANCNSKREGKTAYIADEGVAMKCTDGEWKEVKVATSSTSTKGGSSTSEGSSSSTISSSNAVGDNSSSSRKSSLDEESSSSAKNTVSSSAIKVPEPTMGIFTDNRNGKTYNTVTIGEQVWMAENLNYETENSRCPLDKSSYCDKYGSLYPYSEFVNGLCPKGWHIPDATEWKTLIKYVEKYRNGWEVGKNLKASSGWMKEGEIINKRVAVAAGDDPFNFSALPAGSCWWNGKDLWDCYSDDDARFWVSDGNAYEIAFDADSMWLDKWSKPSENTAALSIRCIKGEDADIKSSSSMAIPEDTTLITGRCWPTSSAIMKNESVTWKFTNTSDILPTTYMWVFTNGSSNISSATSPTVTYNAVGTGTASLILDAGLETESSIACSGVTVKGPEIVGCTCAGELATTSNDIAVNRPVKYTWSVSGCSSEGSEPFSYVWSGSASGTGNSSVASYTRKGKYAAGVTVTNTDGKSKLVACSSVLVADSDDPFEEIDLTEGMTLQSGSYYIPTSCRPWAGGSGSTQIMLRGGSSDDCLNWIYNQVVEWDSQWGAACNGNIHVSFPLYLTIPDGEYMEIGNCY